MSVEIKVPFQLAPDGSIAVVTDPNEQAQQHVQALVATSPGERVMLPTYGVPVRDAVFAPDDDIAVGYLTNQISTAMAVWEPNISVNTIDISDTAGDPDGFGTIEVDWSINNEQNASSTGVLTATILVGGTVVETGG